MLVGVSDYLTLDADLKGPSNDFRLMAKTLVQRWVDPAGMAVLTAHPTGLPKGMSTGASLPPLTGDFVFPYSSQSDQRSFKYALADGTTRHGEFTLRLTQVLHDAPSANLAQVLAATCEGM